ncbi:MAG: YihY/virulence factor BrkB family protein [Acidipropionibacterium sp.]|jgi:membrane protein|nr:YihY/virulence factor BrkB family protein [Acidipropionibacterium sp.]
MIDQIKDKSKEAAGQIKDKSKETADQALQRPQIAHLVRAQLRYNSRLGNHFAASITYFTVLAAVPMLAFAFSVLSVVLVRVRPDLFDAVKNLVVTSLGSTGGSHKVADIIDASVRTSGSWWTLATTILVTLWTGVSWIGHIRQGILAQWEPSFNMVFRNENFVVARLRNALAFITSLAVLLVTFSTAQAGSALSGALGRWLGLSVLPGNAIYVTLAGLAVSTLAGSLFFIFLYGVLPRSRRNWRAILSGSLAAGICLAVLQTGAGLLVRAVSRNRAVQAFGSIIVVMLVLNILARMILFVAAWIATADQPAVAYHWNDADAPLEDRGHTWTVEGHWEAAHAERDSKDAEKDETGGTPAGETVGIDPAMDGETDRNSRARWAGWRGFLLGAWFGALLSSALRRSGRR